MGVNPPKSIDDARRAEEVKSAAEQVRIERNLKMENILKTKDGRDVVASILVKTGIFSDKWTGNSEMFRLAGMRSVGLWLRDWVIDADMEGYFSILKESKDGD